RGHGRRAVVRVRHPPRDPARGVAGHAGGHRVLLAEALRLLRPQPGTRRTSHPTLRKVNPMSTTTKLRELRNYVNGEFKPAREGATLEIVNPSTGEAYATAPLSGAADIDDAMKAARAALAAGNTIVLKPSDTTPASTVHMAELFADILPPGVFNVVCGDRGTGAGVVSHPIPEMVSITGSIAAGKAVARAAADTLKRCHLELGGKAPVIVFDDADLSSAAADIAIAGYFNAGQDCTAATRVLASGRVHSDPAA